MPSNVITGRNGKITVDDALIARVTEWSINPTLATSTEWGDSDSAGYTSRAAGRRDATADTEGKYDTVNEVWDLFQPGDVADLALFMGNAADSPYWNLPRALCNDFSLTVDIDSSEVIGWEASWGADGPYYGPGDDDLPAKTLP